MKEQQIIGIDENQREVTFTNQSGQEFHVQTVDSAARLATAIALGLGMVGAGVSIANYVQTRQENKTLQEAEVPPRILEEMNTINERLDRTELALCTNEAILKVALGTEPTNLEECIAEWQAWLDNYNANQQK